MSKRFLLSLSRVYGNNKMYPHEYFPGMTYDPASVGVWMSSIEEAVSARERLKQQGMEAAYNVISYDDPWEEAESIRSGMVPQTEEECFDDDVLILGDNDKDPMDIVEESFPDPLVTGEAAITIADVGNAVLYFCRDGARIPITMEEAKALVKISPKCIHLYENPTGEAPF